VILIRFQTIQNHHGEQCASEVSQLKHNILIYRTHFFIKPVTTEHLSADIDMVADISCILKGVVHF